MIKISLEQYDALDNCLNWAFLNTSLVLPSAQIERGQFMFKDRSGLGVLGVYNFEDRVFSSSSVNGLNCFHNELFLGDPEPEEQLGAVLELQALVQRNPWLPSFELVFRGEQFGEESVLILIESCLITREAVLNRSEALDAGYDFKSMCVELNVTTGQMKEFLTFLFELPIKYGLYFYSPEKGFYLP